MSVPEFPTFPRTFYHGGGELDPTPPHGYSSWAEYDAFVLKGEGPMTTFASPGTVPRGSKASVVFTREDEDVATIGMHFVHVDGSEAIDFLPAQQETIEGLIGDLWGTLKPKYTALTELDRVIWHDWGVGIRKPNPQTREFAYGTIAGTGEATGELPPQVAVSITFKTSTRKTWGRVYMPAPVTAECDTGRLHDPDEWRTAFGTLLDGCAAAHTPLVIWSPRHGGEMLKFGKANHLADLDLPDSSSFARTVDQVQVDDLFDVIRSRRYGKALVRSTHTLP